MNNQNDSTLTYIKIGDYYIPALSLDNQPDKGIGVYGRMREQYLEEHRPGRYSYLISSGKLFSHLLEVDEAAQNYLDAMIPSMAAGAGVTEELKACDQMAWMGQMNTIRAQVDEMIKADLIYC